MSDETKPETPEAKKDGPDYRPTKQIPKVEIQQSQFSELKSIMTEGFSKVDTAIFELGERVIRVEIRQKDLEERMGRHSGGTRQLSTSDAEQTAAIALIKSDVADLKTSQATQTEKLTTLEKKTDAQTVMLEEAKAAATKLYKNPAFRAVVAALWTAFLFWLGSKGIKVQLP